MIKGINFDIDNTIYSHYTNSIPPLTLKSLNLLKQNNIKIGINTSRGKQELTTIPNVLLEYADFISTATGAHSYSKEHDIIHALPINICDKLIDYFHTHNVSYRASLINDKFIYSLNTNKENKEDLDKLLIIKSPYKNAQKGNEYLAFLIFDTENLDMKEISNICDGYYIYEWTNMGDILANNVSKATGVDDFCSYFKLDVSEVIAFGDETNDIEMLQHAGIGIATKQANEDLKIHANDVCDENIDNGGIFFELIKLDVISVKFDACFMTENIINNDNLYSAKKALKSFSKNNGISVLLTNKKVEDIDYDFINYICNNEGLFLNKVLINESIKFECNKDNTISLITHFLNIDRMKCVLFSDNINESALLNKLGLLVYLCEYDGYITGFDYCTNIKHGLFNTLKKIKAI